MKKFAFAIFMVVMNNLNAQDSLRIFIEAGRPVGEVLTADKIYQYPNFAKGKIIFKDGSKSEARLNYNYLNGEIEFINPRGDTLAIAKEQMFNIGKVYIDTDYFVYDRGYMQKIVENASGKLLKKQTLDVLKREKIGAYNQSSSTSAIDSYNSFTDDHGVFTPNLIIRENITLILKTEYFFGDQYNLVLPATKKNIVKLFPSKKHLINTYLKQNTVNFKNEADLKKLFKSVS
jgi:hypothetical protein